MHNVRPIIMLQSQAYKTSHYNLVSIIVIYIINLKQESNSTWSLSVCLSVSLYFSSLKICWQDKAAFRRSQGPSNPRCFLSCRDPRLLSSHPETSLDLTLI